MAGDSPSQAFAQWRCESLPVYRCGGSVGFTPTSQFSALFLSGAAPEPTIYRIHLTLAVMNATNRLFLSLADTVTATHPVSFGRKLVRYCR